MTGTSEHGTGWSDLDTARLLLDKLGVKPADLMAAPARAEFPLIADYIPLVEKAVTKVSIDAHELAMLLEGLEPRLGRSARRWEPALPPAMS